MKPKIFASLADPELVDMIFSGAIGVIPTDTVYGLVASAKSEDAIRRMYSVKSRKRQPGTTIAAFVDQLSEIGFPTDTLESASQYWPNAVSIQMDATHISSYLSTGQSVMAARIPNSPELLSLLKNTGPLMTTSANEPGKPTSHTIDEAMAYFGDSVDFYVDAGFIDSPASTIIEISPDHSVTIHRQGAYHIA